MTGPLVGIAASTLTIVGLVFLWLGLFTSVPGTVIAAAIASGVAAGVFVPGRVHKSDPSYGSMLLARRR